MTLTLPHRYRAFLSTHLSIWASIWALSRRRESVVRLLAVLAVLALSCTQVETQTQMVYEPYLGEPAYPNLRPTFTMPSGDLGVVSNQGSDSVSLLDLTTSKVLGSAPVGRDPVDNDGPHHLVGDRARGFVYVGLGYPASSIDPGPHAEHGGAPRPGFVQKLSLTDLRKVGEVRVNPNLGDMALSDDGRRLVVSHFDLRLAELPAANVVDKGANLAVIDPDTIQPSGAGGARFVRVCVAPNGIALSPESGRTAYVACYGEDSLAIVDLDDASAPIERIPVGATPGPVGKPLYGPYSVARSPFAKLLAVTNIESKEVGIFDRATKAFRSNTIHAGGAPWSAVWSDDESTLFVPTQSPDALVVIEVSSGTITRRRAFDASCQKPHHVAFSSDRATLYVTCEGDHTTQGAIVALDPTTLDTKASFPVGVFPDRMAVLRAP